MKIEHTITCEGCGLPFDTYHESGYDLDTWKEECPVCQTEYSITGGIDKVVKK